MNYNVDHIDDLIGKYLAGEAAEDEINFIELWTKESEGNRKYFDHCKLIFDKTFEVKTLQEFDADAAWARMKSKLQPERGRTVAFPVERSGRNLIWRVAASILIVFGIGYFAYNLTSSPPSSEVQLIAETATKTDTLPDGSDVFLNKQTELVYTYDKQKKNRVVKLKGEAYFNINQDKENNFVIEVDGVFIRDIGTSFNVKAYPDENTIEVVVEEGKVMFYTDTDSGIYLSEKGKGIYNRTTKNFSIEQPEENVLAYKTKLFSFTDTDLRTAVATLNEVYDKKIVLSENLNSCRLTVSFDNEDVDEIAAIMAETLGLTIHKSGSEIRLEGSGCEK